MDKNDLDAVTGAAHAHQIYEDAIERWNCAYTAWHIILTSAVAAHEEDRILQARRRIAECETHLERLQALVKELR